VFLRHSESSRGFRAPAAPGGSLEQGEFSRSATDVASVRSCGLLAVPADFQVGDRRPAGSGPATALAFATRRTAWTSQSGLLTPLQHISQPNGPSRPKNP